MQVPPPSPYALLPHLVQVQEHGTQFVHIWKTSEHYELTMLFLSFKAGVTSWGSTRQLQGEGEENRAGVLTFIQRLWVRLFAS